MFILYLITLFFTSLYVEQIHAQGPLNADEYQVRSGKLNEFGRQTVESLDAKGLVKLNRSEITGPLVIDGGLISYRSVINTLKLKGDAHFEESVVLGEAIIDGALASYETTFNGRIIVAAERVILSHSKAESISVQLTNTEKIQLLELLKGTEVTGDISFESGEGLIMISSDSKILGKVTGAKVQKKS